MTARLIPHDLAPARIRAFTTFRTWMHHGLTEEEWKANREWATGTDYVPCRFFIEPGYVTDVPWTNQELRSYRDPDALTLRGRWLAVGIAAVIVAAALGVVWVRLGRPL